MNRSATWRVWTGKKVDDVYLCESMTGGDWKVSHHNMWKARIAMTKELAEAEGVDRVVVVEWRDQPDRGWREGAGLLIPCAYLRKPDNPLKPSVVQIPPSPTHSCVRIRLMFEEPGAVCRCLLKTDPLVPGEFECSSQQKGVSFDQALTP